MDKAVINIKVERFKRVLELVARKQRITLAELEKHLHVSRVTIQRDLVELEDRNLIRRFHGGAMSLNYSANIYDHQVRKTINVDFKKSIVKKAAGLIKPGQFIGLDGSSTAYFISEAVLPGDITVVTCNLETFSNLSANGIRAIVTGGWQKPETGTLTGPEAVATVKRFHFDMVFLSAEAFVPNKGFFDPYEEEINIKQAFMENTAHTVMMLDISKIKASGGQKLCDPGQVDTLITDKPGLKQLKNNFKGKIL